MKKQKMSFKSIKDVLSRDEMKQIMAGSYTCNWGNCSSGSQRFGHWVSSYCYISCTDGSGTIMCC